MGPGSQAVVGEIRRMIRAQTLGPGDRLPTQRLLCERFGVGRDTLREALRSLEAAGLVDVRLGGRGGAFIAEPSLDRIGDVLGMVLAAGCLAPGHGAELRAMVELSLLPLVVARATDRDICELLALLDAGPSHQQVGGGSASTGFHERLAECAGNPAILIVARSVRQAVVPFRCVGERSDAATRRSRQEHRALVQAVEHRDLGRARQVMRRHFADWAP
jgi:DNA-binding FadR family transcriptional regulator